VSHSPVPVSSGRKLYPHTVEVTAESDPTCPYRFTACYSYALMAILYAATSCPAARPPSQYIYAINDHIMQPVNYSNCTLTACALCRTIMPHWLSISAKETHSVDMKAGMTYLLSDRRRFVHHYCQQTSKSAVYINMYGRPNAQLMRDTLIMHNIANIGYGK